MALLLSALALVPSTRAAGPPPPALPFACPVLDSEPFWQRSPFASFATGFAGWPLPPDLVIVGESRPVGGKDDERRYELKVEQVLFGEWKGKTLRFEGAYRSFQPGRRVHVFSRPADLSSKAPDLHQDYAPREGRAVAALFRTRRDYAILSSPVIVRGNNVALEGSLLTVEVQEVLRGPTALQGRKLSLYLPYSINFWTTAKRFHDTPKVYLLKEVTADPNTGRATGGTVTHWLPVGEAKAVREVLARAKHAPIITRNTGLEMVSRREVLLHASPAETVELLGSPLEQVSGLAARLLLHEGERAVARIADEIQRRLLRQHEATLGDHGRLRHLITVLGEMKSAAARRAHRRLLDRLIAHITQGGARRATLPQRKAWEKEEEQDDVNHALVWLLQGLGEKALLGDYADRLLRLRRQARGAWAAEVELALTACRFDDLRELAAARKALAAVRPARARTPALVHGEPHHAFFSPDGKHLATVSRERVKVWRTADWQLVAQSSPRDFYKGLQFSADGKHLLGWALYSPALVQMDWRSGRRVGRPHPLPHDLDAYALSANGKVVATGSERGVQLRDAATGGLLQSWPGRKGGDESCSQLHLRADGRLAVWLMAPRERDAEKPAPPLVWYWAERGGAVRPCEPLRGSAYCLFSPVGHHLVSVTYSKAGGTTLRVHDTQSKFKVVARVTSPSEIGWPLFSAGGKYLLFIEPTKEGKRARLLSFPELRPVSSFPVSHGYANALSPDGKLLVLGHENSGPYLVRTDTGARIAPATGHTGAITTGVFSSDGQVLRTLCEDRRICRWRSSDLKLQNTTTVPRGLALLRLCGEGGRYLLCQDQTAGKAARLAIVDADTAKVVRTIVLPEGFFAQLAGVDELDGRRVVLRSGQQMVEVDHQSGKVLRQGAKLPPLPTTGFGRAGEGLTLTWLSAPTMARTLHVETFDAQGGKPTRHDLDAKNWVPHYGLVAKDGPVWVAEPQLLRLVHRTTLRPVSERSFRGAFLGALTFSADGTRYAFREQRYILTERYPPEWSYASPVLIRAHDRATHRTLAALPAPAPAAWPLLSPDGSRLAILTSTGIEVWPLPKAGRRGQGDNAGACPSVTITCHSLAQGGKANE